VDDILKRLGAVESSVSEARADVGVIKATLPHLATKEDIRRVEADVGAVKAVLPHLATREDLKQVEADVSAVKAVLPHLATRADINALEAKIIRWMIGLVIASGTLAFSVAKFVS
jgi:hypothetical protein